MSDPKYAPLPIPVYQQGDDLPMPDGTVSHIVQPTAGQSSSTQEAVIHSQVVNAGPEALDTFLKNWYANNP